MNFYQAIVEIVKSVPDGQRLAAALLALLILTVPTILAAVVIKRR